MNVLAAAQALNRKAAEQKWHHFCDPSLAFNDPIYKQFLALWREPDPSLAAVVTEVRERVGRLSGGR